MRSVLVLFIAAMLAGCFEPSVEYSGDAAEKAEEEAAEEAAKEAAEQVPDPLLEPPLMERGKAIMDSDLEESDEEEETG